MIAVANLGEGLTPPPLFWVKKKNKQIAKGRKASGASKKMPLSLPHLAQGLNPGIPANFHVSKARVSHLQI